MTVPSPFRLFLVVLQPPLTLVLVAAAIVGFAVMLAIHDPAEFNQVYALALLVTMFSASTGFVRVARTGVFDGVFTGIVRRHSATACHLAVAAIPGALLWAALVLVDVVGLRRWPLGLHLAGLTAWMLVTTLSWFAGLNVARYEAGVIWLGTIFTLGATHRLVALGEALNAPSGGATGLARQAGAAVLCPVLLIASPEALTLPLSGGILAIVVLALGCGFQIVQTADLPLVEVP